MPEISRLPVQLMLLVALALATWIVTETLKDGALRPRSERSGITVIVWCRDQAPIMEWAVRRLLAWFDRTGIVSASVVLVTRRSCDDTEDVAQQMADTWDGVSLAVEDELETCLRGLLCSERLIVSSTPGSPEDWDRLLALLATLLDQGCFHIRHDKKDPSVGRYRI